MAIPQPAPQGYSGTGRLASGGGSPATHPVVWTLMGLHLLVWLTWTAVSREPWGAPWMTRHFLTSRAALEQGRVYTLLAAIFTDPDARYLTMHVGLLWWMGRTVEERWGRLNLVLLYVACGLVGALGAAFFVVPVPAATGGVLAVTVMAGLLVPRRVMNVLGLLYTDLRWLSLWLTLMVVLVLALDPTRPLHTLTQLLGGVVAVVCYRFDLRVGRRRRGPAGKLLVGNFGASQAPEPPRLIRPHTDTPPADADGD